jgi:restriction endonuclease Mrr
MTMEISKFNIDPDLKDQTTKSGDRLISVELGSTPQDLIDSGIERIETEVKEELLAKLKEIDPFYSNSLSENRSK